MRRINIDTDYYRRDLPHLQRSGAEYFVTFRLAGSLPKDVVKSLKAKRRFSYYDRALDSGTTGPMWLKDPKLAQLIFDHILDEATRSYRVDCFTIMSNHVHILLSPFGGLQFIRCNAPNKATDSVSLQSSFEAEGCILAER